MNKNTFFGKLKNLFGFLHTRETSLYLDIGGDDFILFSHTDMQSNSSVIKKIEKELFPSTYNGQIENSEDFLANLSFVYDIIVPKKVYLPIIPENSNLYIISRQKTPEWQREIIKNGVCQIHFDSCFFSSHEEIIIDLATKKLNEAPDSLYFFRFYGNEILINSKFEQIHRADIYPNLFVFALKEFLENKYDVMLKSENLVGMLKQHFAYNPRKVGKKNIKYRLPAINKKNEYSFIEPNFYEVSDALRPVIKATMHVLRSMSSINNQSRFYYYSDSEWFKSFLNCGFWQFNKDINLEFMNIEVENGYFFLNYNKEKNDNIHP